MFLSALLLFGQASMLQYIMPINGSPLELEYIKNTEVGPEEMTYHALLYNEIFELYFCGGTLLSSPYVLTAAECVVNRQREDISVHADLKSFTQTYIPYTRQIREIIIHDEYDPLRKWHNDIALLRLASFFPLDIRYVHVPDYYEFKQTIKQKRPLRARVSGYGKVKESRKATSNQMLKSSVYIYSWEVCKRIFANIPYTISNTVICGHDNENVNSTRISDVGSSLIYNFNKVIGIALSANWGIQTAGPFEVPYPVLFTNTSLYSAWIRSRILERLPYDDLGR